MENDLEKNNLADDNPQKVEFTARMNVLDAEITKNAREPWYKKQ